MLRDVQARHETVYRKADYLFAELEEVNITFEECKKQFFCTVSVQEPDRPKPSAK